MLFAEQGGLSNADLRITRALLHKISNHLTAQAFEGGRYAFCSLATPSIPSLLDCHRRMALLAGFDSVKFDCCINSCICYAPDHYRDLDECPFCHKPQHNVQGRPRKQFSAVLLIPILLTLVATLQTSLQHPMEPATSSMAHIIRNYASAACGSTVIA